MSEGTSLRVRLAEARAQLRKQEVNIAAMKLGIRMGSLAEVGGDIKLLGSTEALRDDYYRECYLGSEILQALLNEAETLRTNIELWQAELEDAADLARAARTEAQIKLADALLALALHGSASAVILGAIEEATGARP